MKVLITFCFMILRDKIYEKMLDFVKKVCNGCELEKACLIVPANLITKTLPEQWDFEKFTCRDKEKTKEFKKQW